MADLIRVAARSISRQMCVLTITLPAALSSFASGQHATPRRSSQSGPERESLATVLVTEDLFEPTSATFAPGDATRLFVTEQYTGRVRAIDLATGEVANPPFLNIGSLVEDTGSEVGLFGLAFHPDYASNGRFFVHYYNNQARMVLAEYRVSSDPLAADPDAERILLTVDQSDALHNGGWIGFGPFDGYLYVALGEGGLVGDPGNAQDLTDNLLGKILRLDVDREGPYRIPPSNPFVGTTGDDEIWAYGLRNPWRASFDRWTGDLYLTDVGNQSREELNLQPGTSRGGENYGWRCREGNEDSGCLFPSCGCLGRKRFTAPIYDYSHEPPPAPTDFVCAIIGGYVYRGQAIPTLRGTYFFADYCGDAIWSLRAVPGGSKEVRDRTPELSPSIEGVRLSRIRAFAEDAKGELYALTSTNLFRIVHRSSLPAGIATAEPADAPSLLIERAGAASQTFAAHIAVPDGTAPSEGVPALVLEDELGEVLAVLAIGGLRTLEDGARIEFRVPADLGLLGRSLHVRGLLIAPDGSMRYTLRQRVADAVH